MLTKPTERITQVAIRRAFPSPVAQLTGNVETLGVELDCLVVLTKAVERITQAATRHGFPIPVFSSSATLQCNHTSLTRSLSVPGSRESCSSHVVRTRLCVFPSLSVDTRSNSSAPHGISHSLKTPSLRLSLFSCRSC